jgi:glyoxylate/hydroxypyruvate reductase A
MAGDAAAAGTAGTDLVPRLNVALPMALAPTAAVTPCIALLSEQIDMGYLAPAFRAACPGVELRIGASADALGALDEIEAAVCWFPPQGLLAQLPRLRLVQSLAAGVEHITADARLPPHVLLCRIVDPDMALGMNAYVCGAVIRHQRALDQYRAFAAQARWEPRPPQSPEQHTVGIAGLGHLGTACATALATIGYRVRGWSRTAKSAPPASVQAFYGAAQVDDFLAGCDTLVCLLPLTAETEGFLDARCFARLQRGAHVIDVGRGAHLVEGDLLDALASGQIAAATLDAFTTEPLPPEHPFWHDNRITVTPHIATRAGLAVIARQTLENLAQIDHGLRPPRAVDKGGGY